MASCGHLLTLLTDRCAGVQVQDWPGASRSMLPRASVRPVRSTCYRSNLVTAHTANLSRFALDSEAFTGDTG